jgi:chorismate mutase/prephenate dehydratase
MGKKKEIEEIRDRLDRIDRDILQNLADRQEVIRIISELKQQKNRQVVDLNREHRVLSRVRSLAKEFGIDHYYAEQLFREILRNSVRYQFHSLIDQQNKKDVTKSIRVSYQGTEGAYSHLAATRHFAERYSSVDCYGFDTFRGAARAVREGEVDFAVLPIENTTAGSINQTYDILGDEELHIVGEEVLKIVHCLMSIEDVDLSNIRRVLSHPKAIEQCTRFLASIPHAKVESFVDTAVSAKKVLNDNDLSQAAIAGAHTADLYGLHVIKHDIANQKENYTRFVIVAKNPVEVDPQIPTKTSLVMITDHKEGALIDCLNVLHKHGLNMSKLESRPRPDEPFKYQFYIDIEGNISDTETSAAIEELRGKARSLKTL